ncbi:MAG: hypothetical protein ABI699_00620 [Caldimonas sp.]
MASRTAGGAVAEPDRTVAVGPGRYLWACWVGWIGEIARPAP